MSSPAGQVLLIQFFREIRDFFRQKRVKDSKRKEDNAEKNVDPSSWQYVRTLHKFLEYDRQRIFHDVRLLQQLLADMYRRVVVEGPSAGLAKSEIIMLEDMARFVENVKDLRQMVEVLERFLSGPGGLKRIVDRSVRWKDQELE